MWVLRCHNNQLTTLPQKHTLNVCPKFEDLSNEYAFWESLLGTSSMDGWMYGWIMEPDVRIKMSENMKVKIQLQCTVFFKTKYYQYSYISINTSIHLSEYFSFWHLVFVMWTKVSTQLLLAVLHYRLFLHSRLTHYWGKTNQNFLANNTQQWLWVNFCYSIKSKKKKKNTCIQSFWKCIIKLNKKECIQGFYISLEDYIIQHRISYEELLESACKLVLARLQVKVRGEG